MAPWRARTAAALVATVGTTAIGALQEPGREITGRAWVHHAVHGETVASIAARQGVDARVTARENDRPLEGAIPSGTSLRLDNRHIVPASGGAAVLINVPQRMLFYFERGALAAAYPVAVGRSDWPTPLGVFGIVSKEKSPTWDVPRSIQEEMRRLGQRVVTTVAPGPTNPLGEYWLGLSIGAIGVHGTPHTSSLYKAATHGCVRMHPDDIAALFEQVQETDTVRIIYEPILVAEAEQRIFLEAHTDIYARGGIDPRPALRALGGGGAPIDWGAVDRVLAAREGVARVVASGKP